MMKTTTKTLIALVAVLAFVAASCGAAADKISEQAAQQAAEKLIEAGTDGDVSVDISGDGEDASVKIETEDGSMSFGVGTEMPDGLTIPVPDGGTVQTAIASDDVVLASLYYDQGRYDEIVGFYEGWVSKDGGDWQKQSMDATTDDGTIRTTMWFEDDGGGIITVGDCTAMGSDSMEINAVCVSVNQDG
jgi:hypothetical protein